MCSFSEIESWQNLWKSSGGCESRWNCGVRASRGVGVLLYDIDATVKEISSDDCGRILSCELKYENKTYIITNVYCPNDSGVRKTFIRDIDPYVTDGSLTEKMHILLINQSKKVLRFLSSLSPFIFIVAIEIDMT
jgi:exonuclease III